MTNPYDILGVDKSATKEQIKKAYRDKSKECHPDVTGGDDEEFKELSWAYELLNDDNARAHYDQFGMDPSSEESQRMVTVVNSLCTVFDDIVKSLTSQQLEKYNLIGIMTNAIKNKIAGLEHIIADQNEDLKKVGQLEKVLVDRLKRHKQQQAAPNFFIETLKKRMLMIQNQIKHTEFTLDIAKGMLDVINEYDFNFDKSEETAGGQLRGQFATLQQMDAFGRLMRGI